MKYISCRRLVVDAKCFPYTRASLETLRDSPFRFCLPFEIFPHSRDITNKSQQLIHRFTLVDDTSFVFGETLWAAAKNTRKLSLC